MNSQQQKNHVSIQMGTINVVNVDEFMNFKAYDGNDLLPFKINYIRKGDKFNHFVNFYMVDLRLNTQYNEDYVEYDYLDWSCGELSYRIYYNVFEISDFRISPGFGILSAGNMKTYSKNFILSGLSITKEHNVPDINAASLLFGSMISFQTDRSLLTVLVDLPVLNYYFRPSEFNLNRMKGFQQKREWNLSSVGEYIGLHVNVSVSQQIYRFVYFNASYQLMYYMVDSGYPVRTFQNIYSD